MKSVAITAAIVPFAFDLFFGGGLGRYGEVFAVRILEDDFAQGEE